MAVVFFSFLVSSWFVLLTLSFLLVSLYLPSSSAHPYHLHLCLLSLSLCPSFSPCFLPIRTLPIFFLFLLSSPFFLIPHLYVSILPFPLSPSLSLSLVAIMSLSISLSLSSGQFWYCWLVYVSLLLASEHPQLCDHFYSH